MIWGETMRTRVLLGTALALVATEALAASPKVPSGAPIDETYRKEFGVCDKTDKFNGVKFPILGKNKKVRWFKCSSDPSKFTRFEALPASGDAPRAVILESKLGHDEDGSKKACSGAKGPTDQCPTSLMLNPTATTPCVVKTKDGKECVPVSADTIPYVVIPLAAPPKIDPQQFRKLSGLRIGDYGVVIARDKVVPVVVADGGPAYKIGEGSTALLKKLSNDGKPHTLSSGVIFILFPGTLDPVASLSPDTFQSVVAKKGCDLYVRLVGQQADAAACN